MKKLIIAVAFLLLGSSWVSAQAQTAKPPNNMTEIAAYSVFLSNYRNKDYKSALKFGRWIMLNMPKTIEGYPSFELSTNLGRFATIYTDLAKQADDQSKKTAYIDTVQIIFDNVFKRFSKDEMDLFSWRLRQGRFYQDYADIIGENAQAKAIDAYLNAFELDPEKFATSYEGYYLKVVLSKLANKGTDEAQQKAISIIKKAEPYANEGLTKYFDDVRGKLFDKPAEQIAYLEKKLEENPNNVNVLQQLRNLYEDQGQLQKVQELNKKLYTLDPSYQNIVALANFAKNNANYQLAVKYLKEAASKTDDPEKQKAIYFNIADVQLNQGNLRSAANYAQKAIDVAPDWGRPYLKLAVIYARQVNQCVQGRKMTKEDKAVYWLVIDYVQKAKRVDPSVASRANTLLQNYRPVTPSDQEIFFSKEWDDGTKIDVSSLGQCYRWISGTTTVR